MIGVEATIDSVEIIINATMNVAKNLVLRRIINLEHPSLYGGYVHFTLFNLSDLIRQNFNKPTANVADFCAVADHGHED